MPYRYIATHVPLWRQLPSSRGDIPAFTPAN